MCDVLLYLLLTYYDIRSQASVCQWFNCHSKTWQALLQKITDIIFRQGEWRSLFSSATPHPLFFVTLIIRHILIGINMKYDTFFSGTVWVAHQLDCDNIKVWREWLSFHGHKNIFVFLTQTIRADWEPALFLCQLENCLQVVAQHSGTKYDRNVNKSSSYDRNEICKRTL